MAENLTSQPMTGSARRQGRYRSRLWIAVNVVYVALVALFLLPLSGTSLLPADWRASGPWGALFVGIAGNLVAGLIQVWWDKHRPTSPGTEAQTVARLHYLTGLRSHCQSLPLAALGGNEGIDQGPTLDDVYIALNTTTPKSRPDAERSHQQDAARTLSGRDRETSVYSALEVATQTSRLVILGDPGAGKSTFVRSVLASLATENLQAGVRPADGSGVLLPILIVLRDLAPRLADLGLEMLSGQEQRRCLAEAVCDQAVADLDRWQAEDFASELRQALTTGRCLLVLDGLDEVPYELRGYIREAVAAVLATYHAQRVILTCRVRSYVGEETIFPDFQAHTLAPFDAPQVQDFVQAWYNTQRKLGRVDARQAESKTNDLTQAALAPGLDELSSNPMLLTTMAIIHQQETRLPNERVRLYNRAVEILLWRWERERFGADGLLFSPGLADVLTEGSRLRKVVEGLAYTAHRYQQEGRSGDDLPRGEALTFLEGRSYLDDAGLASAFLDYVDQRAGLLVGQGGALGKPTTYRFPHRTFQEYLAGCYLVDQRNRGRVFFDHAGMGDLWNLAARLGAEELLYNRRGGNELCDLAYYLCPSEQPTGVQAQRAVLWAGTMVALLGAEVVMRDPMCPRGGMAYMQHLRQCLLTLLGSALPAPERAEAGIALAHLGDPRFRDDAWYLPDEPLLGFVEIPARSFLMGSDPARDAVAISNEQPQHPVDLPYMYYIAHYPVTVAQFKAFVDASGYQPGNAESLQGLPNHPVVYVNWHDALQYCDWLTARLREWSETPEPLGHFLRAAGWCVTLPSEAEWEKAARGDDGRLYPWGDDPNPNRGNYYETGIGKTSAVGCFPEGVSPYGAEEMSGNVWEWTRSLWGPDWQQPAFRYPYKPEDGREQLQAADDIRRVVRGGGFWGDRRHARCAYRNNLDARGVFDYIGFRVVVRPCL